MNFEKNFNKNKQFVNANLNNIPNDKKFLIN